ncbi:hypothetical protein AcW1_006245 [Taiwanofungus camphoratus]|nr:hypothetical protein AcW2_005002 [Antrodia cinnamomea]KAI0958059.1 hypothetical protein AcW1_006245 [Antrodia cinnamomea]
MAEGDESLVDKVVPRRAAARKASRLAAEQLESSPVSSDREGAGRSFGEPAKARGSIKYTYGGKGKNKNSPTKVRRPISETSPVRAKVRNATAVRITPKGRVSLGAKGNRPTTSSKSSTPGNGLTTLTDTDPEPEHLKEVRRRRPRDSTSARPVDVDKTLTPSGTRTKASNNVKSGLRSSSSRKRTLSRPPSDRSSSNLESNSVLTPLSSPEPDRPDVLPAFKPPSNRHMSTPGNKRGFSLSTLSSMPSSRAASTSSADKHVSLRSAETRHGTGAEDEAWDLSRLGPLVWVKVDTHGKAVDDEDEDVNTDTLWWPGKVISSRIPLRVTLFGDSPRHSQTDEIADVRIFTPSLSNILPMAARGILRFNENNYKHSARTSGMQESPKKKPRLDFEARWKNARDLMLKTDEEDNDGLPMMLSNYVRNDSSPSARSDARDWTDGKEGASISDDDNLGEPHGKVWRAPSCDPMYDIPGELVLAREQKSRKDHWPAQLQAYIKPTNRREKPKYKVLFYDGMTKLLGPDMFYTTMDKDFGTCQLGLDKFNYGMNEEHEELDTADDDIDPYSELEDDTVLRIASPLPSLPAPSPLDFTTNLSIADQFNYVKPVLAAVIKGEFEPARDRHDAFMRGAAARQKVCETAFARGNLRHEEVEELLRLVRGWARRREKREGLNTYKDSAEPSFVATAGDHVKFHDQASTNRPTFLRPLTPTSQLSMSDMELGSPSSEAEPPPSSFTATEIEEEHSIHRNVSRQILHANSNGELALSDVHLSPAASRNNVSEDVEMKGSSSPLDAVDRPRPRTTFKDLSPIEKITYCANVLLREAVLQLLLWRSGQRTRPELETPPEEQRLHDIAMAKADETDWVQDIIRLRQAAEGKMLSFTKGKGREAAAQPASTPGGGTRSRPRRHK